MWVPDGVKSGGGRAPLGMPLSSPRLTGSCHARAVFCHVWSLRVSRVRTALTILQIMKKGRKANASLIKQGIGVADVDCMSPAVGKSDTKGRSRPDARPQWQFALLGQPYHERNRRQASFRFAHGICWDRWSRILRDSVWGGANQPIPARRPRVDYMSLSVTLVVVAWERES
jgi:hypothetical protein